MIARALYNKILNSLEKFPVVGLIGARQVGKTTLAKTLAERHYGKSVYVDLERPSDLAKLNEPELYLESHKESLVILDEVQRKPDLFPLLRSLVDSDRRPGRFLILGSTSPDMIRQSSESLAGRIIYHELSPLSLTETGTDEKSSRDLWIRGGYPPSYLAETDASSYQWREAFIQTHLERDIPNLGINIAAPVLRRFWTMLAHYHGQAWNGSKIAASLGLSGQTVRSYLDILESTFMVRQLQPFFPNIKKRLVKTPKVYLRDSGLLHALLRIEDREALLGHPSVGPSWEGWVIEQVFAVIPESWSIYFYRTLGGAEIDLVVQPPASKNMIAMEIKRTLEPKVSKGFYSALSDLGSARGFFVYPGKESYPLGKQVQTLPASQIASIVEFKSGFA